MSYVGKSSLEIYVLHCYFTALNRSVLLKIGLNNFYLNVIVNFIISLVGCLIIKQITEKLNIHKYIFAPGKQIKRRESNV